MFAVFYPCFSPESHYMISIICVNVNILYRDIRTYGFSEEYYRKARDKGVVFIRYDEENKPVIKPGGQGSGTEDMVLGVYDEILKRLLLKDKRRLKK